MREKFLCQIEIQKSQPDGLAQKRTAVVNDAAYDMAVRV